MELRDYQSEALQQVHAEWDAGAKGVCLVMPTGSGKTATFSYELSREPGASVAVAHRRELVTQMSLALARYGVRHRVIGSRDTMRECSALHMEELQRSYFDPNARCAVASVDTLRNADGRDSWFQQVRLQITDECHHLLEDNKWGQAAAMFPNARLLGVTATPLRADGKGLGRHADGLFDAMVVGPTMRDLITRGYLCDYRIFAPPSSAGHKIDLSDVTISAGGDYNPEKLRAAVHKARITGDVVSHYLRIAPGKLGITFCVDVDAAAEMAQGYRDAGVPAEVLTGNTPSLLRSQILRRFRNREILQLCAVDIVSEGFDLPALEVASSARPTQSYGLYCQQFGRLLRPMPGKERAIWIDHSGNVDRHKLPDMPREWSLDRRDKRKGGGGDGIGIRICPECASAYERYLVACPYCGHEIEPSNRSAPEFVEGDLQELDPGVLAFMRGEVERNLGAPVIPDYFDGAIRGAKERQHWEKIQALNALRKTMELWGGWQDKLGHTPREQQRRFFMTYGVDVLTTMTYKAADAIALDARITKDLNRNGVVPL